MNDVRLTRRKFLANASAVGATLAMGSLGVRSATAQALAEPERLNMQPDMTYRVLGSTDLLVSCLSFGCIELQDDRLNVLDMAVERGVNVVHVHPGYNGGQAIKSLGKFFQKKRDKVWLMLKSNSDNIDAELATLNTDHTDILCVHDLTPEQLRDERITAKFERLRDAGKTRFLCFTDHNDPVNRANAAVASGMYGSVLAVINLGNLDPFRPVLKDASKKNVGIHTMKCWDPNGPKPQEVARAMLAAGVTSILKTLNTMEQAEAFLLGVSKEVEITDLHRGLEYGRRALAAGGICTLCGKCTGACPQSVAITDVLRNYQYYVKQHGKLAVAREQYAEIRPEQTALACGNCGNCEQLCPQGLPVRTLIREAHETIAA